MTDVRTVERVPHDDEIALRVLDAMRAHERSWLGKRVRAHRHDILLRLKMEEGSSNTVAMRLRALDAAGYLDSEVTEYGTGYVLTDKGRAA